MADVHDRWMRDVRDPQTGTVVLGPDGKPLRERTTPYGSDKRYVARWRDDQHKQCTKSPCGTPEPGSPRLPLI